MDERTDSQVALAVRLRQDAPIPLDVDFTCSRSELLALVGPSGAGKTSVLRAIAGLLDVRESTITADGETWTCSERGIRLSPQLRRVGFVFQDYALFPHLTAEENVMLAMHTGPIREKRDKAQSLLARIKLDGLGARRPHQLSGGQRQRVALARALAREPRVLLLDEPFSAVDHLTRERLKRELAILRRSLTIPILFITHDVSEAMALADRIAVLHQGRQLAIGPSAVIRSRPPSALVARLIGHANVYTAQIMRRRFDGSGVMVDWCGHHLACATPATERVGRRVHILVPADAIVLLRPNEPAPKWSENVITGTIGDIVPLGDHAVVSLLIAGSARPLQTRVSTRALARLELRSGQPASAAIDPAALAILDDVTP